MAILPFPNSFLWAFSGVIPLSIQIILLHPYYQGYVGTRLIRMSLIPIVIYIVIASLPKRIFEPRDSFLHFNFPLVSIPSFHMTCLSIFYGLYEGPVYKTKEELEALVQEATMTAKGIKNLNSKDDGSKLTKNKSTEQSKDESSIKVKKLDGELSRPPSWGELVRFSADMIMCPRALKCVWGPPTSIVPLRPKMVLSELVRQILIGIIWAHLQFQFVCAISLSAVRHRSGPYGFLIEDLGLPPSKFLEWVAPKLLTVILGGGAYSGFALAGNLFNLVEIIINEILRSNLSKNNQFRPDPINTSFYPPLFFNPWFRTSLTEFWSKGWQAVFRHHFVFCGALPVYHLCKPFGSTFSKLGGVIGAMSLSAIMHELCLVSISKFDPTFSSSKMFLAQGIGIILESIFKKITGHRVGGVLGWIWTYSFLAICGESMVNSWVENGLGNGLLLPKDWKLFNYVFPFGCLISNPTTINRFF